MPEVSLARWLARHTSAAALKRGRTVHQMRKVRDARIESGLTTARVVDNKLYLVLLEFDDGLGYACTCEHAKAGSVCKHVYATALYVDKHQPWCTDGDAGNGDSLNEVFPLSLLEVLKAHEAATGAASKNEQDPARRAYAKRERQRWQRLLPTLAHPATEHLGNATSETWYLLDDGYSPYAYRFNEPTLRVVLAQRRRLKNGRLGKATAIGQVPASRAPDGAEGIVWNLGRAANDSTPHLSAALCRELLPELCATGRVGISLTARGDDIRALAWDAAPPWQLVLEIQGDTGAQAEDGSVEVTGALERVGQMGAESVALSKLWEVFDVDLVIVGDRLSVLSPGHARWTREVAREPLRPSHEDLMGLASLLLSSPVAPRIRNPARIGITTRQGAPIPRVRLRFPDKPRGRVRGDLVFLYDGQEVGGEARLVTNDGHVLVRDYEKEARFVAELRELGFRIETITASDDALRPFQLELEQDAVEGVSNELVARGYRIYIQGRQYRRVSSWRPILESEQDWFNLKGKADFDGLEVPMPELLKAVRENERWIRLRDGSLTLLPEGWQSGLTKLAGLMPPNPEALRLDPTRAMMVAGVLEDVVELSTDAGFAATRERFRRFEGIRPLKEPRGFKGELRAYQRLALGWLDALDDLGFGGCLADDMGLGKTVVVLAWLLRRKSRRPKALPRERPSGTTSSRLRAAQTSRRSGTAPRTAKASGKRTSSAKTPPSLLVVPKSLLFNWQREAERFAPGLKVLLHHGPDRKPIGAHFDRYDLILTSYGTLRRDAATLGRRSFSYVVLDEAHSIKNAWTEAHKAALSLSSERRLALTGTPIENHLGELWNLLTFLNPGVFEGFKHLRKTFESRRPSRIALEKVVLTAVKPFILRRTKQEVAKDLPERVEKTLHVTLSKPERKAYDDLAEYYRKRILGRRASDREHGKQRGRATDNARHMAEALQALLRLRQAACHPGLLDESKRDEPSTKLNVLVEQLTALRREGHKALVFSQFTKLLGLIVPRLEAAGLRHAYLDGKTRDREAVVRSFQEDPERSVFLISLKAGGVGLNLVAADYVFLLDPWWNPASEAQAIDRAHRIGQHRTVIAYRLLSKDTVEQKVAALQQEKRELADALFGDGAHFAAKFSREDLEALLET